MNIPLKGPSEESGRGQRDGPESKVSVGGPEACACASPGHMDLLAEIPGLCLQQLLQTCGLAGSTETEGCHKPFDARVCQLKALDSMSVSSSGSRLGVLITVVSNPSVCRLSRIDDGSGPSDREGTVGTVESSDSFGFFFGRGQLLLRSVVYCLFVGEFAGNLIKRRASGEGLESPKELRKTGGWYSLAGLPEHFKWGRRYPI